VSAGRGRRGKRMVDHVDIDRGGGPAVRRASAVWLLDGRITQGLNKDSARSRWHYCDGWDFVEKIPPRPTTSWWSTCPTSEPKPAQHNRLYDADFLERCRDIGGVVTGQAGCPTLWRNEVAAPVLAGASMKTFGTVLYFGSDEATSGPSCLACQVSLAKRPGLGDVGAICAPCPTNRARIDGRVGSHRRTVSTEGTAGVKRRVFPRVWVSRISTLTITSSADLVEGRWPLSFVGHRRRR